ncbi:hypothetical protein GON09_001641 [Rhodococcus sp. B50]|nr:hypothetical protein [Rhodococcus sp. B50]
MDEDAALQQHRLVAQLRQTREIMGGHEDRVAARGQFPDDGGQCVLGRRVDPRERLVEQQQR